MKKNIWVELELFPPSSVNSRRTANVEFGIFSKKILITPVIFYAGTFFLTMLAATGVSSAEANKPSAKQISQSTIDNPKDRNKLRRLMVGFFQSRAEVEEIAVKLRQLGFEIWINKLNEGYVVNAGAFSSESNLKRAVSRLQKAGLGDKVRVVEVDRKPSKAITSSKSEKVQSTAIGAKASEVQDTTSPLDGYVPKKEYAKLQQEVEILKAQMQSLLNQKTSSETKIAEASTDDPPSGDNSQTENGLGVDEGSREEEAADLQRQLDTFIRREKVLFKRGELEFEVDLIYAQSSDRAACFNAKAGSEFCQRDQNLALSNSLFTRSVGTNFSLSYGIVDDLALTLSIPYSYSELESDTAPFTINNERVVNNNSHFGIGDIFGALRYTALHESGTTPSVTLNLIAKAPSGDDLRRLGSGFWNIGGGISLTKSIDPVVFFGSLGYTARLPAGEVDLGDQINYSIGGGFSLNDRVSVAIALSGSTILRNEINGIQVKGSDQNLSSLQFSSTIRLTKALFVEPFVAIGLTEGSNDFIFGINMPYRFEDKYPLPFFSD